MTRHIAVVGVIVMVAIVTVENDLVAGVGNHDTASRLAIVVLAVIIDRIAQQRLAVLGSDE